MCLSPGCIFTPSLDYRASSSLIPPSQRNSWLTFGERWGGGGGQIVFVFFTVLLREVGGHICTSGRRCDKERGFFLSAGVRRHREGREACLWSANAAGQHCGLLGNQGRTDGGKLKASGLHRWETALWGIKSWKSRVIGAFWCCWGVFWLCDGGRTRRQLTATCHSAIREESDPNRWTKPMENTAKYSHQQRFPDLSSDIRKMWVKKSLKPSGADQSGFEFWTWQILTAIKLQILICILQLANFEWIKDKLPSMLS